MNYVIDRKVTPDIADAIEFVLPAVSDDKTRYSMNGVYFGDLDDNVAIVATDGRRLHRVLVSRERFEAAGLAHTLEPREHSKGSSTAGSIWMIEKTRTGFVLASEVNGRFPDWNRVIPSEDSVQEVCKTILPKPKRGADRSKYLIFSQEVIKVAHLTKSFFNLRYLEDMAVDGREWKVSANMTKIDENNPSLLSPIRFDSDDWLAVIMPCVHPDGFAFGGKTY